jgi:tetratricopeptide (TPR) repeat protein
VPSVLNVGGGSKDIAIPPHYAGWNHLLLDIDPKRGIDVVCDARELREKFPPGGQDAVYCSHNLEHYYRHDVDRVLAGFAHVLNAGGFAEIRVPDVGELIKLVAAADLDLENEIYSASAGGITALDVIYGYGPEIKESGQDFYAHKTGFTRASLARALLDNGFSHVFFAKPLAMLELRAFAFKREPDAAQKTALQLNEAFIPPTLAPIAGRQGMVDADRRLHSADAVDRAYAEAVSAWQAGRFDDALRFAGQVTAIDANLAAPYFLRGSCLLQLGQPGKAAEEFQRCMELGNNYPLSEQARVQHALCHARMDLARGVLPEPMPMPENTRGEISVIVCSVDAKRFESCRAMIARLLVGVTHEVIGIHDARSLAEGYGRGIARARYGTLLFVHDDLEILNPDFAARLLAALEEHDIVGIAGTTRVVGGAWHFAGHPYLRGQVAMRAGEGLIATIYGVPSVSSGKLQVLDGLLLACSRDVATRIGFDATNFDGWHLYDMDFTLRAARAGLSCATRNDILVVHNSQGSYDQDWLKYAERFIARHGVERGGGIFHRPELVSVELRSPEEWRLVTGHLLRSAFPTEMGK